MMSSYDYIVVGGGSAGCIAAANLAEDGRSRVLLLECGPRTEQYPETLHADGYKDAFINDSVIWERFSTPQPKAGNQRIFMGSGTGLGGSGSVNGMVYTRGAKQDYDEWPTGWTWDDIQADFQAIERVLRPNRRAATEFTSACIEAAKHAGFRHKEDLNDGDLSGVLGYEWMTYEGDRRRSAYVSYILDAPARDNLVILPGARAHKIELDASGRASAVCFEREGRLERAEATREILMACGALETPKILMLSGIGPSEVLREHGIPVVADVPGVGRDLHDHPNVPLFFLGKTPVDCFYPQLYGFHRANASLPLPKEQSDTCYVFYPARSSFKQAAKRILPGKVLPERLYGERGIRFVRKGLDAVYATGLLDDYVDRMWGIVVILGKPLSRGRITLRTTKPADAANLDPMYFSAPKDMETMVKGVRLARRIANAPTLESFGNRAINPTSGVETDADIASWVGRNAITTYHFAGTCRMGDDAASVVDSRLRFKGIPGLRIVDASAIPFTPVSALNAPSMLVGHRGAKYALEERGV